MSSEAASSKVGNWVVDVDTNTGDKRFVVTLHSDQIYLDFWCDGVATLSSIATFLCSPTPGETLRVGEFCDGLTVKLRSYAESPDVVFLSVSKPDGETMAHGFTGESTRDLRKAIQSVIADLKENG